MKYLVLGATGMAGHMIAIYLKEQGHDVIAFSRKPFPFCANCIGDIADLNSLKKLIAEGGFDAVVNCIGILNQNAEQNKHEAVFLNSYLPQYLSHITRESVTKVIHMSTDCVFSGRAGGYAEQAFRDGTSFYDRSKALGELENEKDLTFRTSVIGPDMNEWGIGLFNWFMKQQGTVNGYTKAIWTGVTTLTLAKAMERAVQDKLKGVYNLVNNERINKYDLLKLFNKHFKNGKTVIVESDDVTTDKSLVNNRRDFDFKVPLYEDMICEMKDWMLEHSQLYPHYGQIGKGEKT